MTLECFGQIKWLNGQVSDSLISCFLLTADSIWIQAPPQTTLRNFSRMSGMTPKVKYRSQTVANLEVSGSRRRQVEESGPRPLLDHDVRGCTYCLITTGSGNKDLTSNAKGEHFQSSDRRVLRQVTRNSESSARVLCSAACSSVSPSCPRART